MTFRLFTREENKTTLDMLFTRKPTEESPLVYTPIIQTDFNDSKVSVDFLEVLPYGMVDSVCSTINPYSNQNIIGSLQEKHDMLNKIFPYDRQTNFSLWFNNKDGNRVVNDYIIGYLDLELIIDNTNNLNLDV